MRVPASATRGGVLLGRANPKLPTDIEELAQIEGRRWKAINSELRRRGVPQSSGGQFYQDTRPPWLIADTATVTLTTAQQLLWPVLATTPTYASDWFPGKIFQLRCYGRITTPAGAGALTIQLGYGTTAAAGALATSAALTMVASQTNISWRFEGRIRCRAIASAGGGASTLLGTGIFETNTAVQAAGGGMVPASAPAPITNADLTVTSGISLSMLEAATTGATIVVHDLQLVAEN